MSRDEAVEQAGAQLAAMRVTCAQMTPREQAERSMSATDQLTVEEKEDLIRAERGMEPAARSA